jgi:hypothetical protein
MWDFEEETRRIRGIIPGLPIPAAQFEEIVATCRDLDHHDRADALIRLTLRHHEGQPRSATAPPGRGAWGFGGHFGAPM